MAKIENVTEKTPERRMFEVMVSFDALNRGDVFTAHDDLFWEETHVATGYLRELTREEVAHAGHVGQG